MEVASKLTALPGPRLESRFSLEASLQGRRSVRTFRDVPLMLAEAAQLVWAAQGITSSVGGRTAPSAGALYPIELYLSARYVDGLPAGIYKYVTGKHHLLQWADGDCSTQLARSALDQDFVARAAAVLAFAAVQTRTTAKYRERGVRYVHLEIGHAAQNVLLQAVALGLSAVVVGAFDDEHVHRELRMPENEKALYLIPVGH